VRWVLRAKGGVVTDEEQRANGVRVTATKQHAPAAVHNTGLVDIQTLRVSGRGLLGQYSPHFKDDWIAHAKYLR